MAGRKRTAAENAEETEKLRIACETALKNALERALSAKDSGASAPIRRRGNRRIRAKIKKKQNQ